MGIDVEGMILLQHGNQLFINSHGKHHGDAAPDPDDLYMIDGPDLLQDLLEAFGTHDKGIAAGQEHVPDHSVPAYVVNGQIEVVHGQVNVLVPHHPPPCAVAAIHGTPVCYQEKDPIRIPVGEPGGRGIDVFVQGVVQVRFVRLELEPPGDPLEPDGTAFVIRVHQ